MSLQAAAQHMASQGRGPDTTLVHMSPKEVRSLQELAMAHGGSLTINPKTGLPEAGFLSSILPMIAGFALGPAGFALMSAPMAGLAVGGLQALRTGNIGKGIMAGLGAYGGAGLGEAFAQSGMQAGAQTGIKSAQDIAVQQAEALGQQAASMTPDAFASQAQNITGTFDAARQAALAQQQAAYTAGGIGDKLGTLSKGIGNLGTESGRDAFMTKIGGAKGLLQTGGAAAAPLLSSMLEPKTTTLAPVDAEQMRFAYDPRRKTPPTREGDVGEYTYFDPTFTRLSANGGLMEAQSMYAEGGVTEPAYTYDPQTMLYKRAEPAPQQSRASSGDAGPYMMGAPDAIPSPNAFADPNSITNGLIAAMFAQDPSMVAVDSIGGNAANVNSVNVGMDIGQTAAGGGGGDVAVGGDGPSANDGGPGPGPGAGIKHGGVIHRASGGISHLGDYSDGGRLLRGPGDGVSDSIPATIANKRPARLADGEFVVPARIVSELGNGSTEAGARKLYAMMDRIQKNRSKSVGKGKVAVNSRSERMLPA